VDVTENGRVDMIVQQLDRIEDKLDRYNERLGKVENRVTRIEAIGAFLQVVWAAIVSAVARRW